MEHLATTARNVSARSGGHFTVIGISETGAASFFCTHKDGEQAELWRDADLQRWLRQRHELVDEPDESRGPQSEPAYKIPGLGRVKKHMASLGVTTVRDLAWADAPTIAAIRHKVTKKERFQSALTYAQTVAGSDPSGATAPGGNGSGAGDGGGAAQGLASANSSSVAVAAGADSLAMADPPSSALAIEPQLRPLPAVDQVNDGASAATALPTVAP